MSAINLFVTLPNTQASDFLDTIANVGKPKWDTYTGGLTVQDIIIDDSELAALQTANPSMMILGAWCPDGSQCGTTLVTDEEGDVTVTGTPDHPINTARLIAVLPDVVTYNEDGSIDTTTPQTVLTDNLGHSWFGWTSRRYS